MTADNLAIGGIAGDHRPPLQGPNSTYELNFRRVLVCDRFSPLWERARSASPIGRSLNKKGEGLKI